jgi:hypothetical protein
MRTSPALDDYGQWTQPSYEVKVRATKYLWGSSGIMRDLTFSKPLILHVNNDTFGEVITIGTQVSSGAKSTVGTLEAGECVSISVQDISGVFATCAQESTVRCLITASS